jgi:peptide-methionine (R)-S-oxide reductase
VVCDEDIFSSKTKYDSGSGWPSFYDAIQRDKLAYVRDYDIGMN